MTMFARSLLVAAVLAMSAGCIIPRSAGYGLTAAPLAVGAADVGMAVGLTYQQEVRDPQQVLGATVTTTSRQVQLPAFEANAQLGLMDKVALNLHASQAGLQPGVKVTVLQDPVVVSVVPQIGFGFVSSGDTALTETGGSTTSSEGDSTSSYAFLAGVRALVSLPAGAYAGVGYDFQYVHQVRIDQPADDITVLTAQSHNLGAAIGYEIRLGSFAIRPELALLFTPLTRNQSTNSGGSTQDQPGARGLYLFPNVTVAAVSKGK